MSGGGRKKMANLPIPDMWRVEYPSYIANRRTLQLLYGGIVVICMGVFFGYGADLYFNQLVKESEVAYTTDNYKADEWDCTSITDYTTADYQFYSYFDEYIDTQNGPYVYLGDLETYTSDTYDTFYADKPGSSDLLQYIRRMYSNIGAIENGIDIGTWQVERASSFGTQEVCIQEYTNQFCDIDSEKYQYVVGYDITVQLNASLSYNPWEYHDGAVDEDADMLEFQDSRTDRPNWEMSTSDYSDSASDGYQANFTHFSSLDSDTGGVCTNFINPAKNNEINAELCKFRESSYCSGDDTLTIVSCSEKSAKDYCYFDLQHIFDDNGLDGITKIDKDYVEGVGEGIFMSFNESLAESGYSNGDEYCYNSWYNFCTAKVEDEWCETIWAPPYQCVREVKQSLFTVTAIAFAQTELVLTVLVVLVTLALKFCFKCEIDHSPEEVDRLNNLLSKSNHVPTNGTQMQAVGGQSNSVTPAAASG